MKRDQLLVWFAELSGRAHTTKATDGGLMHRDARAWIAEAHSAIDAAFPTGHAIRQQFAAVPKKKDRGIGWDEYGEFQHAVGVFDAARRLLEGDRVGALVDMVRAETESELLDVAATLLSEGYLPAAAVTAGAALETHLRRLCEKNMLTIAGGPSIDRYDGAVAQARNAGVVVYEKTDSARVRAWGAERNDGAHSPTTFKHEKDAVQRMIDGIREFIARIR